VLAVIALTATDWRQQWRGLRLAALAEAPEAFGSTSADWTGDGDTADRWRARLSSVPFNAIITCDGTPAGMVGATTVNDDSAINDGAVELLSMWVSPEFRGRGNGDAPVRAVVNWARVHFPGRAVVLSVKAANHRVSPCMPDRDSWKSARRPTPRMKRRCVREAEC